MRKRRAGTAWRVLAIAMASAFLSLGQGQAATEPPEVNGVINGDFEVGDTPEESGWSWWSWDDAGSAGFCTEEAKTGERSLKIGRAGEPVRSGKDWVLTNEGRLEVQEGEVWTASAWVKYDNTDRIDLDIIEVTGDDEPHPSSFRRGRGAGTHVAYGTGDWRLLQATSIVPPDCDTIYVRIKGVGQVSAWVDGVPGFIY